jgi:acetyl-CoA/propionyl-CoA carboxylase biotin carboxyl carrier protein
VIPAALAGGGLGSPGGRSQAAGSPAGRPRRPGPGGSRGAGARLGDAGGDALVSPMQGTIIKIVAEEGQQVKAGDTVVVLEAMKMEQPLAAHKDGTVTELAVEVGQTISAGGVICQLPD